jgi:hypothetical protein
MGKYAALGDFLRKQSVTEVPMTFEKIEKITGARLPPSAKMYRGWWSNNPKNSVMTKVWLDAGFQSARVDMAARRLVFRRMRAQPRQSPEGAVEGDLRPAISVHHPHFGALKGLVRIDPRIDLTQPADPDWGEGAWGTPRSVR